MSQICTVIFENRTPRAAGVTIVEIGAKWWFKGITGEPNGNSDQDNRRVQIAGGQSDRLQSSTDECTYQVLCIVDVELSNGNTGRLNGTASAGDGECLQNVPFVIQPRRRFTENRSMALEESVEHVLSHRDINVDDLLELVSVDLIEAHQEK